jgi:hypothetical protein
LSLNAPGSVYLQHAKPELSGDVLNAMVTSVLSGSTVSIVTF